jgi:hypothetical protein
MEKLINKELAAVMLGVSTKTIECWEKLDQDPLPIAVKGSDEAPHQYARQDIVQWYVRGHLANRRIQADGEEHDYFDERAQKPLTYRQVNELERLARKEFVNYLQGRLLAFPERAAQAVYGAEDPAMCHEILTHQVHQFLFEFGKPDLPEEAQARILMALWDGTGGQET